MIMWLQAQKTEFLASSEASSSFFTLASLLQQKAKNSIQKNVLLFNWLDAKAILDMQI